VKNVNQSNMHGFIEISDIVFANSEGLLIDPGEEKLKAEFSGVSASYIPVHQLLRIDKVDKQGVAKIKKRSDSDVVAMFPNIQGKKIEV